MLLTLPCDHSPPHDIHLGSDYGMTVETCRPVMNPKSFGISHTFVALNQLALRWRQRRGTASAKDMVAIVEGRALCKRAKITKEVGGSDITASGPRQSSSSLQHGSNKVSVGCKRQTLQAHTAAKKNHQTEKVHFGILYINCCNILDVSRC